MATTEIAHLVHSKIKKALQFLKGLFSFGGLLKLN